MQERVVNVISHALINMGVIPMFCAGFLFYKLPGSPLLVLVFFIDYLCLTVVDISYLMRLLVSW